MKIVVPLRIRMLMRKEALAAMAREFSFTMGVTSESTLATITDGISSGLLQRVEILLYNARDEDEGYVFFEIDWVAHAINAGTGSKQKAFQVDIEKNIAEQIAPVTAYVSAYLHAEAQARGVTRTHTIYRWVDEPNQDELRELRRNHGLKTISDEDRRLLDHYRRQAQIFGDDEFSEMSSGGAFRPIT